MGICICDGSYKNDLTEYEDSILKKYGVSARSSEREIICLSDAGNVVAAKLYADMVFYKKILRTSPYRDAFRLYLKASGLEMIVEDDVVSWKSSPHSYPLAFWMTGYFLVNYRRESVLKNCEKIEALEKMSLSDRVMMAFELAAATLEYENVSGAVNLIGRMLKEASEDSDLFSEMKDLIEEKVLTLEIPEIVIDKSHIESASDCAELADTFFIAAAKAGYVFACNSLAAREADRIVDMSRAIPLKDGTPEAEALKKDLKERVIDYICYLRIAADRYEPYASNRLGLFYMTGEIRGTVHSADTAKERIVFKEYVDTSLAKKYFIQSTVYPDENSAWGYFNLMKYFPKMYEKDIELMNEHMDCIKALNPAVYDLAMDL